MLKEAEMRSIFMIFFFTFSHYIELVINDYIEKICVYILGQFLEENTLMWYDKS